jgi:hypothetical protein
MYVHYRGTTFQFVGSLQNDGAAQDLTNATVIANVYDPTGTTLIANLTTTILDPATGGLLGISYPNTSAWPVGKARIDVVITLNNGQEVASDPCWFRIAQNPVLG